MAEISIKVGGRHYQMACEDGQEDHLRSLAARIDNEAQSMMGTGQISEARLLLMSALMVADQLDEAEHALRAAPPGDAPALSESDAAGLLAGIDDATTRITALGRADAKGNTGQ